MADPGSVQPLQWALIVVREVWVLCSAPERPSRTTHPVGGSPSMTRLWEAARSEPGAMLRLASLPQASFKVPAVSARGLVTVRSLEIWPVATVYVAATLDWPTNGEIVRTKPVLRV